MAGAKLWDFTQKHWNCQKIKGRRIGFRAPERGLVESLAGNFYPSRGAALCPHLSGMTRRVFQRRHSQGGINFEAVAHTYGGQRRIFSTAFASAWNSA